MRGGGEGQKGGEGEWAREEELDLLQAAEEGEVLLWTLSG
jgi:hypothetical protein